MAKKKSPELTKVENITHKTSRRKNIPPVEAESYVQRDVQTPVQLRWPRNPDLDPQLVWKGKDELDGSDLVVNAPPIYIQEKIHPKSLVDDLMNKTTEELDGEYVPFPYLFDDFNGLPKGVDKTEFYRHDQNWTNRMILGDSLQVMASLADREGLRGKVQCVYMDPPYGIKFNSNFQWSTTSTQVKDGKIENITREPEQVKAFRDTWRHGINSYLSYLRDRFTVARDLLTESGSIFVQIGDENVHRVRAVLDEVFGEENFVSMVTVKTTGGAGSPSGGTETLASVNSFVLWYAKNYVSIKYRQLFKSKSELAGGENAYNKLDFYDKEPRRTAASKEKENPPIGSRLFRFDNLTSQSSGGPQLFDVPFEGKIVPVGKSGWKTTVKGMQRLINSQRIGRTSNTLNYIRYLEDFPVSPMNNMWTDTGTGSGLNKIYVVQTTEKVIQRCLLMATDPGDLVLDPTCGSGTTAYVAEQWGRRWITIDTSRVALALARARLMGAVYPYYLLSDSPEGQAKLGELSHRAPSTAPTYFDIKQGFVYQRVPHITLKSIANNAEIDVIWDKYEPELERLRQEINAELGTHYEPWEMPRPEEE